MKNVDQISKLLYKILKDLVKILEICLQNIKGFGENF